MSAMILAAGRGERLRPLTDSMPKALVEVGGVSLIERHLHMLAAAGVPRVVINLGWRGEQIAERVGSGRRYGLHVVYSPEYENVLETGGGIVRALPILGPSPFWVVNADILTDYRLPQLTLPQQDLGHLVLVPRPPYLTRGDFDLADGRALCAAQPTLTFSGIACYRPELFAGRASGRFPLAPLLRQAATAGRLGASLYRGAWHDVGTPERLAALRHRTSTPPLPE